jgi:hypothetical protein
MSLLTAASTRIQRHLVFAKGATATQTSHSVRATRNVVQSVRQGLELVGRGLETTTFTSVPKALQQTVIACRLVARCTIVDRS